jgi:hypothetical protein
MHVTNNVFRNPRSLRRAAPQTAKPFIRATRKHAADPKVNGARVASADSLTYNRSAAR